MARSKGLHAVTAVFNIPGHELNATDESGITGLDRYVDFSQLLSKRLGRNVKQGQSYRLVGWSAGLQPINPPGIFGDANPDSGYGATVRMQYCPTTFHSAQAWRDLKNHYWKQSNFRKGLGVNTKYDEFEVAFDKDGINQRTSTVYVGGINDTVPEACVLFGGYDDQDGLGDGHISAEILYNTKNPVDQALPLIETDLIFDDTIQRKQAKFDTKFPSKQYITVSATHSAPFFYDHDILVDEIYPVAGTATSEVHFLPEDNHLDILAGLMKLDCYITSPDDENFIQDTLRLYVTFFIEGWNTLYNKPSKKRLTRRTRRGRKGRRKGRKS